MFAALLGYNPVQMLLGHAISRLPASHAAYLTGHTFFPSLISAPFERGLAVAFGFAIAACLVAAVASLLRGSRYVHEVHGTAAAEGNAAAATAPAGAAPAADALAGTVLAAGIRDAGMVPNGWHPGAGATAGVAAGARAAVAGHEGTGHLGGRRPAPGTRSPGTRSASAQRARSAARSTPRAGRLRAPPATAHSLTAAPWQTGLSSLCILSIILSRIPGWTHPGRLEVQ